MSTHGLTKKKFKNSRWLTHVTCGCYEKISKLFELKSNKKKIFFFKKNKVDMRQGKVKLNLKFSKSNHTHMQTKKKKNFFF